LTSESVIKLISDIGKLNSQELINSKFNGKLADIMIRDRLQKLLNDSRGGVGTLNSSVTAV